MYANQLIREEIYLDSLPAISAEQLTGLGVTTMGHQMKLLREASKLQLGEGSSQAVANPPKAVPGLDLPDSSEGGGRPIRRNSVSGDNRAAGASSSPPAE